MGGNLKRGTTHGQVRMTREGSLRNENRHTNDDLDPQENLVLTMYILFRVIDCWYYLSRRSL